MSEQRINELEAEVSRLRAMLARAGVSLLPPADLPNEEELDQLLAKVEARFPALRCPKGADVAAHKRQFAFAIRYLAFAYRLDRPNTTYAATFWIDNCREFLRSQGFHPTEMGLRPFVAAAVASGICFESLDEFPFGISLGINLGSAGQPSNAWRGVLRSGVAQPVERRNRAPARPQQLNMVR
jgi:hypothetical protein